MDTVQPTFNTAATGTGLRTYEIFVIWAAIIDDAEREERRREWRREFNKRRARGCHPVPPRPAP